jgi:hypothetical protein
VSDLRSRLVEAGAKGLFRAGAPMSGNKYPRHLAEAALDAMLDVLEANADEWRDIQEDYPQLYEVAPSRREHMVALGILPSEVPHRRVTTAVVSGLLSVLRGGVR